MPSTKSTTAAAAASRITIVFATAELRARNRSIEQKPDSKVPALRNLGMKIPHGIEEQTSGRYPSSLAPSLALTGSSLKQWLHSMCDVKALQLQRNGIGFLQRPQQSCKSRRQPRVTRPSWYAFAAIHYAFSPAKKTCYRRVNHPTRTSIKKMQKLHTSVEARSELDQQPKSPSSKSKKLTKNYKTLKRLFKKLPSKKRQNKLP